MRFSQISKNFVVVYPGRFQPFHMGHQSVYKHLTEQFGSDAVSIATSDKVELPKSPFSFAEKKALMMLTGVPASAIVQTKNPYQAQEITAKHDPAKDILVFAVSEKDMTEDPRFSFKPKKDGSPSYLQPYKTDFDFATFDQHGYVYVAPTIQFTVLGKNISSASEIRKMFSAGNQETRMKIFTELFGQFNQDLFNMVNDKLGNLE